MGVALTSVVVMVSNSTGGARWSATCSRSSWPIRSRPTPRDLALLAFFGEGQFGAGFLLFMAGARLIPAAESSLIGMVAAGRASLVGDELVMLLSWPGRLR